MDFPPGLDEFAPGAAGSLVAVPFLKGPWHVRLSMVFGGAALSFYGTNPVAGYLDAQASTGLVGFLIGLFGMAVVSKVYELIESVEAAAIGVAFKDWLRSKLGV